MKIRSICLGLDAGRPLELPAIERASRFLARAAERFSLAGLEVQTTRLALTPFAEAGPPDDASWVPAFAQQLENVCSGHGVNFVSMGPIRWGVVGPAAGERYAEALSEAIVRTQAINATIETVVGERPSGRASLAAGRVVARLARETPEGFGNFRFAAIARCGPNIPFFPAAFHAGGPPTLTLGLQAADLVRSAFDADGDHDHLEQRLGETLGSQLATVDALARDLADESGVQFGGTDLTPAPFGPPEDSAAGMLEAFGVGTFGAPGTLAATAALTGMLRRLPQPPVGYSGLMLPVLEDSILADRTSAGLVSVSELLLYSAVCGTGLDTVPLPGDATAEDLGAIVLDVTALACALRKPLSCRLFPVPGKAAGDLTEYQSPYLVNGRVLPIKAHASSRLFERFSS